MAINWLKFFLATVLLGTGSVLYSGAANAACVCSPNDTTDDGMPTLQSISVDGDLSDWSSVTGDPDNNVCDGPRTTPSVLVDRDAPVQSTGRDITHFATTWDSTNLYFFTERTGSSNNVQTFVYYADVDNDGLMETGEPVIGVEWSGNTRNVDVFIGVYNEVTSGGDSLVDGSGFGDGHSLPGDPSGFPKDPDYSGSFGSAGGSQMEFRVQWSDLGFGGPSNITFHVSATNKALGSANFGAGIDDNLGGCGGGSGSTQFAALTFVPDVAVSGNQGATVTAAHSLTNDGSGDDTFDFTVNISGAHTPTVTLYFDNDVSGTLTAGDVALTDTNGDGNVDTGVMVSGATVNLLAVYDIATQDPVDPSIPTGTATITITATSEFDTSQSANVVDTVDVLVVPDIIVVKSVTVPFDPLTGTSANAKAIPGAFVDYTITITNQGPGAADVDSLVITDDVPSGMELFTGDLGGTPAGPVIFNDGSPSCGVTYSFTSTNDTNDDVSFSTDGTNFNATANGGFDSSISHIRINPKGDLDGATVAGDPTCSFLVRMRVQ